jgi:glycerol-3-phosphate dehydrogenase
MASETLDKAMRIGKLPVKKCLTKNLKLSGFPGDPNTERFSIYGSNAFDIQKMIMMNPPLGLQINSKFGYCQAELLWIIRNEMPRTVEDVLSRRTRALILNAAASIEMAPLVALLLADELGYDEDWQKNQVNDYTTLARQYLYSSFNSF